MIISRSYIAACAVLSVLFASVSAQAVIVPSPIATDARIKTIMYSPNEIYKFTGYYRYQSNIQFAADEEIGTISLGDSVAWQLNPMGNRLFIKPIDQDATTNMTLITNKHTYFFELHAEEAKSISDKNLTFELRFQYPGEDSLAISTIDHAPDLEQDDLSKYNFKYTMTGSNDIAPIRIFDDGEFTYFEFHNKNAEVPAFFQVDSQGNEGILNYRTRGDYIVVERVMPRYTLRHGNSVLCVFNEAMSFKASDKASSAKTSK
jgi:type IV secretion system protein VirB9